MSKDKFFNQAFNPFLPSYEYIPDGEPHIFDGRVYLYGSHDLFNGRTFCMGDYVCWSAPCDDLKDWRYEGVIYKKVQDPGNRRGRISMYAPDVCKGPDGRYYLYYFYGYTNKIAVAVCDTPAGKYEFYGYVHYPDGTLLGKKKGDVFQFDPGVFAEGGEVYLYTGFCPGFYPLIMGKNQSRHGPVCTALDKDMLTVKEAPKYIGVRCKKDGQGTAYKGHEFFEAASLRKINNKYYFIYSSALGHELCYAVSNKPDGEFEFGGTIVSIGDVGLRGIKGVKDAANFCGNTHGSILENKGKYYIFYHRQTNRHCFSRQACAEEIEISKDGKIKQVEVTSCGLNGGALRGAGTYEARTACILRCKKGGAFYLPFKSRGRPYFTQSGRDREDDPDQYIADISDGTVIGFKYYDIGGADKISVSVRGSGSGGLAVSDSEGGITAAHIKISPSKEYAEFEAPLKIGNGKKPLFFKFTGKGKIDFKSFTIS